MLVAIGVLGTLVVVIAGLVLTGVIGGSEDDEAVTGADDPTGDPPEATVPVTTEPPDATAPATTEPADTEPGTSTPGTTGPGTTGPGTTEPAEEGNEVLLEALGDPGPDPFTTPVAPEPDEILEVFATRGTPPIEESVDPDADIERPDPGSAIVQRETHLEIDGDTAGLYGGTLDSSSCDPDQLVTFLGERPELGEAWAGVHGITPEEIPEFVSGLTPVNLAADTRVLNHGFTDGEAVARHSVLQRGSAVMVDELGVPRANCYCGNPLLESEPTAQDVTVGEPWEAFDERTVIVVVPAPEPIEEFTLTDVATGDPFDRPAGSTGEFDQAFLESLGDPDFTPGVDCGLVPDPGDLGDAQFLIDDIRILLEGEGENCEIAAEVAVEFLRLVGLALFDDVFFPYRPNIQGWSCSTGPFLAEESEVAGGEFFGCLSPNNQVELRLVPG